MNEACLRDSGQHPLPCASLLVRLVKAPRGARGEVLEVHDFTQRRLIRWHSVTYIYNYFHLKNISHIQADKVPEADWRRLGLWKTRPNYMERVYLSLKCAPSRGECQLFHFFSNRTPMTIKNAVSEINDSHVELQNGISVSDYIKVFFVIDNYSTYSIRDLIFGFIWT